MSAVITRAKVTINVEIIQEDAGPPENWQRFALNETFNYTVGIGANSLNKQWNAIRTLAGAPETHDLNGGLSNIFGSVSFTKQKLFIAKNPANGATLTIGGGSNAFDTLFTGTLILPPGSLIVALTTDANGWAVDAGTGDQLVVAGTATKQYTIALGGE